MTTPQEVAYEWDVQALHPDDGWIDLPCTDLRPSMDMDRVPYCNVTFTLQNITEQMWQALDPRTFNPDGNIRFRLSCSDVDGDPLSWLGRYETDTTPVRSLYQHIRTANRDRISGVVTVTAAGGESILDDRMRLSGATVDTAAATVQGLVEWALFDTFGGVSTAADILALTTSIPSGDRRLMLPGETFNDLIEPELQAIGYRLYEYWGLLWATFEREHTYTWSGAPSTIILSTFTVAEGAPANVDPIVFSIEETMTRDGDFADGVLIKYDNTDNGGSISWQRSGDGTNTKARAIEYRRAEPAGNAAELMVERTQIRGVELTIRARARFDVTPGMRLYVYTRGGGVFGSIRAVSWDAAAGEMTIRAQTGQPIQ